MIKTRITEMLGIKYPIMSAPMGPFYTTELTVAVSEAGGLGVLSHTNLRGKSPVDLMVENMEFVVEHTDKPFGFNIRTARMQPDAPSLIRAVAKQMQKNPKIREQCVYAVTSAGTPREAAEFWKKKNLSLKHFHVAPALWLAEKIVATKCDGLVMTGYEGGGHQSYEGVTSVILVQQAAKEFPQMPLVACGGFATPQGVAMALSAGADAVAMGTRFIATKQSEFHKNYKAMIYPAKAEDTIMTTGAFGPIRLLKNKFALEHGKIMTKEEKKAQEAAVDLAALDKEMERYELVYKGDVENGAVLLGQSVGLIDAELNVDDIVSGFSKKAEEILKKAVSKIQ